MHRKRIDNLIKLSANDRYEYFIRTAAEKEKIWCIVVDDKFVTTIDFDEDDEVFFVWPHEEVAQICCRQEYMEANARIVPLQLDFFLKSVVPEMSSKGILFGIFFNSIGEGLTTTGESLAKEVVSEYNDIWFD